MIEEIECTSCGLLVGVDEGFDLTSLRPNPPGRGAIATFRSHMDRILHFILTSSIFIDVDT